MPSFYFSEKNKKLKKIWRLQNIHKVKAEIWCTRDHKLHREKWQFCAGPLQFAAAEEATDLHTGSQVNTGTNLGLPVNVVCLRIKGFQLVSNDPAIHLYYLACF